jgi:hypothetical protein
MNENITVARPVFYNSMNAAARRDFRRRAAAWDLANKTGEPTEDYIDECAAILASIRRWGNRRAAAWERANTEGYPDVAIARDDHAIETGLNRLNAWLNPRGLHLAFYGLYPTLEDEDRHSLDLAW